MNYNYPKLNPDWELTVLFTKVLHVFNLRPETNTLCAGVSSGGDQITVHFSRELTAGEKTLLDTLMSQADAGLLSSSVGFTVFEVANPFYRWSSLEVATALTVRIFNLPGKVQIWIEGALTPAQKTQVRTALNALIKEV